MNQRAILQILFLFYDDACGGHQSTLLWSLLHLLALSIAFVELLALFFFDDYRVLFASEHVALEERMTFKLLTFKHLTTILLVLLVLDEVDAVELALLVDHVVALELIGLTFLDVTFECGDARLKLAILHVLSIPVRDLMELK